MIKDKRAINILIIEDNPGDLLLVEDFLEEQFLAPTLYKAKSYSETVMVFESRSNIDVLLLDLGLPDLSGEQLVSKIQELSNNIPIIILTGYTNLQEALKLLSKGVSDYLIKDELSASALYKSVIYSIQRKAFLKNIQNSRKQYTDVFNLSPQPMWVFDAETLRFLDVNNAAIENYGYSREEFLMLSIDDIRPKSEIENLHNALKETENDNKTYYGAFTHVKKTGERIIVDIYNNYILFNNKDARLVLANDITERQRHVEAIERQNELLKDIAWTQSHEVRAPLARIMGLVDLIKMNESIDGEHKQLLSHLIDSANELDTIIQDIVNKSNII